MNTRYICSIKPGSPRIDPINLARLLTARRRQAARTARPATPPVPTDGALRSLPTGIRGPIDWPSRPRIETELRVEFGMKEHPVARKAEVDLDEVNSILSRAQELNKHPGRDNVFIMNGEVHFRGIYLDALSPGYKTTEELIALASQAGGRPKDPLDCEIKFYELLKTALAQAASPAEKVDLLVATFNYLSEREVSLEGDRVLSLVLLTELSDIEELDPQVLDQVVLSFFMDQSLANRGRDSALIQTLLESPAFKALFRARAQELGSAHQETLDRARAWMAVLGFSQTDVAEILASI